MLGDPDRYFCSCQMLANLCIVFPYFFWYGMDNSYYSFGGITDPSSFHYLWLSSLGPSHIWTLVTDHTEYWGGSLGFPSRKEQQKRSASNRPGWPGILGPWFFPATPPAIASIPVFVKQDLKLCLWISRMGEMSADVAVGSMSNHSWT